jgi:hypothetical protein
LAILTGLATILLLFFPDPPFALRFVVTGFFTVGEAGILIFYFGRLWEWSRCKRALQSARPARGLAQQ